MTALARDWPEMKLSEMKQLLAERGVQLTKSLGQNFLHDTNQLRKIAASARLSKADKVLEIGPGLGPLTNLLVQQAGEVLAIEKDARLLQILERRYAPELGQQSPDAAITSPSPIRFIHADALDFLRREPLDWQDWKLVSNLPYSVASPILVELAQAKRGPRLLVATLQIEVARRLMAKPGETAYGLLTLLVQMNYQPESWFKIPASCFFPSPEVDSACVTLHRREAAKIEPLFQLLLVRIIKRSFSQPRKMMLKLLKQDWPLEQLENAFRAVGLSPCIRAETVGLDQFAELARQLQQHEAPRR